jgi:hypothetical protein
VRDAAIDAAADVELLALGHVLEAEAELEALDALEHVAAGLGQDLAVLVRDEPAELVDVALHQVLEAEQDLHALLERGVLPPGEGGAAAATAWSTSAAAESATWPEDLAVARVVDGQGLAGGGVLPLAADPVGARGVGREGVAARGERGGEGRHGRPALILRGVAADQRIRGAGDVR